ncbi:MAG: hypothetical protein HY482_01970 [Candidatus Wildermuthbacteria bacterium]|nr:hypothetical protein [Candidatus Wildermuthbacteria bacterium]
MPVVVTIRELEDWYRQGRYDDLINLNPSLVEIPVDISAEEVLARVNLLQAWSLHQKKEYWPAEVAFAALATRFFVDTFVGDSARRGLAHALFQQDKMEEGRRVLEEIRPGIERSNARLNELLRDVFAGRPIPVEEVLQAVAHALGDTPYRIIHGHVLNNAAWILFQARHREEAKPYLPILQGLIEMALGIYDQTKAQPNHIASCSFRAATIFFESGWFKGALTLIDESISAWEKALQGKEDPAFRRNLQGAEEFRLKILAQETF